MTWVNKTICKEIKKNQFKYKVKTVLQSNKHFHKATRRDIFAFLKEELLSACFLVQTLMKIQLW